jgi:glycosyltransferase involved in cell wall biosynthesis
VLARVLDALRSQTLPLDRWELVVIDNNSKPPLVAEDLDEGRGLPLRLVRETRQGKVPAHRRGILEARADLLVLIDDDNVFEAEYLEKALAIARENPELGAFGGIARPVIPGGPLASWQTRLLPFIGVRDYGPQPITSREDRWGPWEPIGAGMVLQRRVGLEFVRVVDTVPEAAELDRIGRALLSAGDSLLARLSYPLGLSCSYQPALAFDHLIPRSRVGFRYLRRMMYGHGRSLVKLNRVLGLPSEPLSLGKLMGRLLSRARYERLAGPLWWCWDLGYFVECRRRRKERRPAS